LLPSVPTQLRELLPVSHHYADPPHPVRLLRARSERPRGRRAADQRDEVAPPS